MNTVDAVKSKEEIDRIESLLIKHGTQQYADIFKLGINTAFRITDLLSVEHNKIDMLKGELTLIEGKTKKTRTIRLNNTAIEIIERRRGLYPHDVYLFQSHSNRGKGACKPLTRRSVARKFQEIGSIVDLSLGTHSMRKTRGYMMYSAGVAIEQIAKVLNHSSPATTLDYIGITKENTLQTYIDFEL